MTDLGRIVAAGVGMAGIAAVGSLTLLLSDHVLNRLLKPMVAFAAGSLLGGAFFHMLPAGLSRIGPEPETFLWLMAGFAVFFALEQFLHWHHCHRAEAECKEPMTWLVLIGDGLHNFLGGLAVAGALLIDVEIGIAAFVAAALHEIPQELGDFAVLLHGGWSRGAALGFNVLSAMTFLVGGLVAWGAARELDVTFLLPFAAGNFIYIAASDLVPQVTRNHGARAGLVHFAAFCAGLLVLYATAH